MMKLYNQNSSHNIMQSDLLPYFAILLENVDMNKFRKTIMSLYSNKKYSNKKWYARKILKPIILDTWHAMKELH